jgi:hypothetical protein
MEITSTEVQPQTLITPTGLRVMKHRTSGALYLFGSDDAGLILDANGSTMVERVNNAAGFDDFYGEIVVTSAVEYSA